MGRRKIEIKPIKDDRNRSVTFLKRKGGLFKKAHELSVLCSVDVAVFIFGTNKKLYEYSSSDMHELITRYSYHGPPQEHKGPSDFNTGGNEESTDGPTPPQRNSMDPQMMPPQFQGQPPYAHVRKHTPSASPPMPNGVPYHPGYAAQRGHTPQPQMGSRPSSRNDGRRMAPNMMPQPSPQPQVNGYAYMQNHAMYNSQHPSPVPAHAMPPQHAHQYPYPPPQSQPQSQPQPQPHPQETPPQVHAQIPPQYEDQHRSSMPPSYPPPGPHQTSASQPGPSPRPQPQNLPHQQPPPPHMSPPPPHPQQLEPQHQQPAQEPQPAAPVEPKTERPPQRPRAPLLNTTDAIKRQPQRKQHSIFTPIDENRSILSQHLASFAAEPERSKAESRIKNEAEARSRSVDVPSVSRINDATKSPPVPQRPSTHMSKSRPPVSIPETTFTPPSRSNSLKVGGMPSRPRLKVQIPDESSENGGSAATGDASTSPRNGPENATQSIRVLPPPSPSATTLLSAGATGPPNPFARPAPHPSTNGNMNIDTPVSALPSRFLNSDFLPSPSSFYPSWDFRGNDSNTLPSPLNFATPVVGTGPSFLRDENPPQVAKRKSPESTQGAEESAQESKRVKVE